MKAEDSAILQALNFQGSERLRACGNDLPWIRADLAFFRIAVRPFWLRIGGRRLILGSCAAQTPTGREPSPCLAPGIRPRCWINSNASRVGSDSCILVPLRADLSSGPVSMYITNS